MGSRDQAPSDSYVAFCTFMQRNPTWWLRERQPNLALERLARRDGVTKREMLERIVMAEEARVTSGLEENAWEAYMQDVTP